MTASHAAELLDCIGQTIVVATPDGYRAEGRLIGLTRGDDGAMIRVLGRDRIERRIPAAGATVTT